MKPRATDTHLDRLRIFAAARGIPTRSGSAGNIPDDA